VGFLPDLSYLQTDLKNDFAQLLPAINNLGAVMRHQDDTLTQILQELRKGQSSAGPSPASQPTSQT
jgi:hypothetical protein